MSSDIEMGQKQNHLDFSYCWDSSAENRKSGFRDKIGTQVKKFSIETLMEKIELVITAKHEFKCRKVSMFFGSFRSIKSLLQYQ